MRRPLRPYSLLLLARPLATLSLAPSQTVPVALAAIRLHRRLEFLAYLHEQLAGATGHHRRGSISRRLQRPRPLRQQQLTGQQRAVRLAVHRTHRTAHQMDLFQRPLVRAEKALVFPSQAVKRGRLGDRHLAGWHVGQQPDVDRTLGVLASASAQDPDQPQFQRRPFSLTSPAGPIPYWPLRKLVGIGGFVDEQTRLRRHPDQERRPRI